MLVMPYVNVYHAGFDDVKSLLDEHGLNQVKEQDQENLNKDLVNFLKEPQFDCYSLASKSLLSKFFY